MGNVFYVDLPGILMTGSVILVYSYISRHNIAI